MTFSPKTLFDSRPRALSLALFLLAAVVLACGPSVTAENDDTKANDTLIEINGEAVSRAEVEEAASDNLRRVELQKLQCQAQAAQGHHQAMEVAVEQIVRDRLIAKAASDAGQSVEEWQQAELLRHQELVTDEKVDQWFEQNKARLQGRTKEQLAPQIKQFLAQEAMNTEIRASGAVEIMLDPFRFDVASEGPVKGSDKAPVTIVEFSDFQCPYCQRVTPTLDRVSKEYGEKVQIVFRQYPLDSIHPQARKAAEASLCAHEQDKFWDLHDLMFQEQKDLEVASLKDKANRLGLDQAAFDACLDSGKYADRVEEDLRAGVIAGVSGTPAFFINGRPLSGAVSFEQMAEVVDDELERAGAD